MRNKKENFVKAIQNVTGAHKRRATAVGAAAFIVGSALVLAGCQSSKTIYEGPQPGERVRDDRAPYARVNLDTVVIIDKALQTQHSGKLAIERSGARRSPTGTLEVFAVIRNRTDFPQQIELRTQFFDSSGAPVEGPTAWKRVILDTQSVNSYTEFSIGTSNIAHYYVEVREGR
jgi:uncharacterized protein YcfL